MTGSGSTRPERVRIIDLLDMARRQKWAEINRIIVFLNTERLRRISDLLAARIEAETYRINGYHQWQRAMVDLLQRLNHLIASREARDDWQTFENTVI